MIRVSIRPVWRFHGKAERDFDFALLALLEALEDTGKLTQAARRAGMSYRHAWNLIERWAALFGAPLVAMERGKGTRLSPLGAQLLWAGKRVQARLAPELDNLATELATALNETSTQAVPALRLHASHDFAVGGLRDLALRSGLGLELQYRGSFEALGSLARGDCELAGFHIVDGPFGARLASRYAEWLKPRSHRLISVGTRTQGMIVARGNPKHLNRIEDLARRSIRLVNRQKGSGTRALVEFLLTEAGIERSRLQGYQDEEFTHAAVAALVAGGQADVGFGVQAAAAQFRLGFVPLARERYFFACRQETLALPQTELLLALLRGPKFRALIGELAGYSAPAAGEVLTVTEALGTR